MIFIRIILLSFFIAAISTHYFEEFLLPSVVRLKHEVYGEQVFSTALAGCNNIIHEEYKWVHPATLSLTVYDKVQSILNKNDLPEVLPNYRKETSNDIECVASILIKQSKIDVIDSKKVRYFLYHNNKPIYGISSPWVSGLAQSFTGQVMLAAYLSTGQEKYLDYSREIANFLSIKVEDGGPLLIKSSGDYWYSEYANQSIDIPEVLNGHLLALDFLYWMKVYDKNTFWDKLFNNGLSSVIHSINEYSAPTWSYYDKQGNLANGKYHRFHIRQLERYEKFDKSGSLKLAKDKMKIQLYIPFGVFERLIYQPSKLLILIITAFMFMYLFLFSLIYYLYSKKSNKSAGN